jgi:hypothetical protein
VKRTAIKTLLTLAPLAAFSAMAQQAPATHPQWSMVEDYCLKCHNSDDYYGQLALDQMNPASLLEEPGTWEKVLKKLDGRLMPPPGNPQPEQARIDDFIGWVEDTLDKNPAMPKAGHVPIQRLNRTEYARTVRDLIGVDIKAEDYLPTEIEIDGFDNMAEALSVSPAFMAQYIRAARLVAHLAVGDSTAKTAVTTYAPSEESQYQHQAGMPPGTRGGIAFTHNFPADGDYQFNLAGLGVGLNSSALETEHTVVMLVDGMEVFRGQLGGAEDFELTERTGPAGSKKILERFMGIPVSVKAGPHKVVMTFVERSRAQSLYWAGDGEHNRMPRLSGGVEVVGPVNITGVSSTPSRDRIFICYPQASTEQQACARQITEHLATRAFGRRVTEADMNLLLPFFQQGAEKGGFDKGIEQVVAAILSNPNFLYRTIVPDANQQNEEYFALDDVELASRLSFFLWSQRPDEELLDLAIAGRLSDPKTLEAQVRRMLADPRTDALVNNFAIKWLNLDNLEDVDPNPQLFPEYSDGLLNDLNEEMRRFLASVLLNDRPVSELMTANYTYVNERLAKHYGIDSVYGPQFRRVALTDEHRFGLLGKGAVMLRTSYGDRTSPVLRGNWVLEKLMGTPSAPPPPNVVTDLTVPAGQKPTTLRARMEKHRNNPTCNQCHGVIDPIGLALENYSVTGRWRDRDAQADAVIDPTTVMPGNIAIGGPVDLRNELIRNPKKFVRTFTSRMLTYALGRELQYFDMPQVRAIVDGAAADDYHLFDLVMGIAQSDAFRYQAQQHAEADAVKVATND